MGRKIILFLIFPCLILAIFLSMAGFTEVGIGDSFYNYFRHVALTVNKWSFEIPKIPNIPKINNLGVNITEVDNRLIYRVTDIISVTTTPTAGTSLGWFTGLLNLLVTWFNFQINFLNFLIGLLNLLINIIQFALTFIYCLKDITKVVSVQNNWDNVPDTLFWYANIGV